MGPLLSERTRILITHHVRLCFKGASNIVWVEKGDIKVWGDPAELEHSDNLQHILNHEDMTVEKKETDLEELDHFTTPPSNLEAVSNVPHNLKTDVKQPKILVEVEKRAQGYVKARLFWKYCVALGGLLYWLIFGFTFLSARGFTIAGSLWIKKWTDNVGQANPEHGLQSSSHGVSYYIQVYTIMMLAQLTFSVLTFVVVYFGALRAGRSLFAEMLECVFRAPLRFFGKSALSTYNSFLKRHTYLTILLRHYPRWSYPQPLR
jgi:ABC transporter transmembrane region